MYNKEQLVDILANNNNNEIFSLADSIRREYVGDAVHLRGLIEFSNICKNSCKYCGLQKENDKLERYRILEDEILDIVKNAVNLGYRTIVLQSGEDSYYNTDRVCKIIKMIKQFDVALTLSIGERDYDEYKEFKKCGADRYLLRIETTDKNLYANMHPNMSFDNRMRCLYNIKELGYEVGTGCLVGLPGQSLESLADDILFFKELGADMVGIGPFIPHPQTPLKNAAHGDFGLALKTMALTRIICQNINIPATTAMETLNPNGRIIALQSGANVVMPNINEPKYRKRYEIYPGKICVNENSNQCRSCIENKIKSIGRSISTTYGNSNSFKPDK